MSQEDRPAPVSFDDRLPIATPEGVELELTLAGIGSRFIAGLLDAAIQSVVLVALWLVLRPAGAVGVALLASASFALIFFYDVLFEVLGGGRTIGKRATGLRVVREGGRPVTLTRSALRNVLRIVDVLPVYYGLGMTVIFITSRNQRIGDLAAGTLVIRDRHGDRRPPPDRHEPPADARAAETWDVSAVSSEDLAAVQAFLNRRHDLRQQARATIAADLASRLRPRVVGAPAKLGDERFLELLAAAKASRR